MTKDNENSARAYLAERGAVQFVTVAERTNGLNANGVKIGGYYLSQDYNGFKFAPVYRIFCVPTDAENLAGFTH